MHRSWFIFITPLQILTNVLNQLWLQTFSYLIDLLLQSETILIFCPWDILILTTVYLDMWGKLQVLTVAFPLAESCCSCWSAVCWG